MIIATIPTILLTTFVLLSTDCVAAHRSRNSSSKNRYIPQDQALHDTIVAKDEIFFAAFNSCDLEVSAAMMSDDLEFFHDQGGYTNTKQEVLEATQKNICGKVTRTLVEGSIEVYPIPGYGATQIRLHRFFNKQEPNAPSHPSKFVHVWKNNEGNWKITKVISLH